MYIISKFNARIKAAHFESAISHYSERVKNESILATAKANRRAKEESKETNLMMMIGLISLSSITFTAFVVNAAMTAI